MVKGAGALCLRSFFTMDSTVHFAFSSAASAVVNLFFAGECRCAYCVDRDALAVDADEACLEALVCLLSPDASRASRVQYSTGLNALISRSRSTIRRRATVCTRPAERPRRTLSQSRGEIW